jgi:Ca2+-transporting ATPase
VNYLTLWYSGAPALEAQTVAFTTWMVGHIFLAMAMRSAKSPLWKIGLFSNRIMLFWALLALIFILAVVYAPPLQGAVKTTALSGLNWLRVAGVPFVTIFWIETWKALRSKSRS